MVIGREGSRGYRTNRDSRALRTRWCAASKGASTSCDDAAPRQSATRCALGIGCAASAPHSHRANSTHTRTNAAWRAADRESTFLNQLQVRPIANHSVLNNATGLSQRPIGRTTAIEAAVDRFDLCECREVAVVGGYTPSPFPDPLDRGKLGAGGRQAQQSQVLGVPAQEGLQQRSVIIASIVEPLDHVTSASPVAQQLFEEAQEAPEGLSVEWRADVADEFSSAQIGCTEAGHGTARRSAQQKRILFAALGHLEKLTLLPSVVKSSEL